MNLRKVSLYLLCLTIGVLSCKKDDDPTIEPIVLRDRTEQQGIDNDSIIGYLETHYYNKSEFEGNLNPGIKDLTITKITNEIISSDADSLLINAVETKTIVYANTTYKYYVLKINQGGGAESPKFCDDIRANYQGFTLDDAIFDNSVNPVDFDLMGVIEGWRRVFPEFNTAESYLENGDGTVTYSNKGVGVMFLPSGLSYFYESRTGILAYSPLIFKFELLQTSQNDHDGDGVPSYLEDLNGDGQFSVNYDDTTDATDDDTDGDRYANFEDADDDGDGISTINEDIDKDGDPTNDDSNGNGIPNYLDKTDKIKKS